MGFRTIAKRNRKTGKITNKKYTGVEEYYRDSDVDKKTVAFYITYREADATRKKVKTDATNRDEALKILNDKKAEIQKERNAMKNDFSRLHQKKLNDSLTLDDIAKIYHPTKTNPEAKRNEAKYRNHISPILGKLKISKITQDDIKKLSNQLSKKKNVRGGLLNPRTVKDIIENLRVIFNWAIEQGYVSKNPVIVKKIITTDDNEAGRVLTDEELEKLWNIDELKMNDRLFLFLKTCYYTGARPAGVIDIQVKHINFTTKKIRIKAMKKGKSYEANASNELLDLLQEWIKKHSLVHDNFIFYPIQTYMRATTDEERHRIKNTAAKYAGYAKLLRKIFDKHFNQNIGSYDLAYRVSVYTMRRTAGTKIYKKHGIVHAKKFLNHTDIKTTMKYLNIDDDMEIIDYGL
ncbi:MAG: site-specific integrase [Sulfurimonas sp.]